MKTLTAETQAAAMLDAERDAAVIPYGEIAHWWRRKAIALQARWLSTRHECSECGDFHKEDCPAREDGGYF